MVFRTSKEVQAPAAMSREATALLVRKAFGPLSNLWVPTVTGLLLPLLLMAQEQPASRSTVAPATTRQVTCTASDEASKPVVNAHVSWKWTDGKEATALTDESGHFSVALPVGADSSFKVDVSGSGAEAQGVAKAECSPAPSLGIEEKRGYLVVPVTGTVRSTNDEPVPGAAVSFKDSSGQLVSVQTSPAGTFNASVPSDRDLSITVEAEEYGPATIVRKVKPDDKVAFVLWESRSSHAWLTKRAAAIYVITASFILYWVIALAARYFCVIQVDRKEYDASIHALEQKAASHTYAAVTTRVAKLTGYAKEALQKASERWPQTALLGMSGHEIAVLIALSNAELTMAECYDRDQVLSALRVVEDTLRPEYSNLADKVHAVLDSAKDANPPSTSFLKATYIDALDWANEKSFNASRGVLSWQNKAFVLVFIGCALLIATTLTFANPTLLLLGFAGGFASRLLRGKTGASDDTELRWTSLFLSPIYGAIAGWAGIMVLAALKNMNALGSTINFNWHDAANSVPAMALAFVFGFSERFFSAVTDMAEKAITKVKNATPQDDSTSERQAKDADAGIPQTAGEAPSKTAAWDAAAKTLTIKGSGLDPKKPIELKPASGTSISLTVDPTAHGTATELKATATADPPAGEYRVIVDGQEFATVTIDPVQGGKKQGSTSS